ncbi:MAG: hypothetical protein H6721_31980 [Sandaracinus sp.]|nr:hypothetical protein [Sandaracinus sp.]
MRNGTLWHASLVFLAVGFGCAKSSEPGEDCPPATAEGACYDACCAYLGEATRTATCGFECRSGRLIDRCAPTPECSVDGGMCVTDAGPLPICRGGACCDQERTAGFDPVTCSVSCPSGFSTSCMVDPAAFCAPTFDAPCTDNTQCTLAIDDCCGGCGMPTLDDFDPILITQADAHRAAVCTDPTPICPGCAVMPNPNLGATCSMSRCTEFDVRALALSACTRDEDCRLRVADCCECGGDTSPFALIAIRNDAEGRYTDLVCPNDIGCPECAPAYPADVSAFCADDGHCAVSTGI